MPKKTTAKSKLTDAERHKRFLEEARRAEADETEEGAERALKSVISRPSRPNLGTATASGSQSKAK
jgi:hypothetical protein